jgi:hypothetical protein
VVADEEGGGGLWQWTALAMAFVGERSGLLRKIAFNVVLFSTARFCS